MRSVVQLRKIVAFICTFSIIYTIYNVAQKDITFLTEKTNGGIVGHEFQITIKNNTNFHWCPLQSEFKTEPLNCSLLYANDNVTVNLAKHWTPPCNYTDYSVMQISSNCQNLSKHFPFYFPTQKETEKFTLAFVVLVAEQAEQVLRLFQTIYRPWNLYCLTYDNHSDDDFQQSMKNLKSCYQNIVMPQEFMDIYWGGISILRSVMNCMKVLHLHKTRWKYVQIVSWNDFPLRINEEMVKIMQIFNGSQDAELSIGQVERFRQYYNEQGAVEKNGFKKSIPPDGLTVYKGSMSATLSREFVGFLFNNPTAGRFYNWSQTMGIAEEQFWSTLIHNLHTGVPGGYPGSCLTYNQYENKSKQYVSRYQLWTGGREKCEGKWKKGSCVFGAGDLSKFLNRRELFAHKIYLNFQPAAYYCLFEEHFRKMFRLLDRNETFDSDFYSNLPSVRYQNAVDKTNFEC